MRKQKNTTKSQSFSLSKKQKSKTQKANKVASVSEERKLLSDASVSLKNKKRGYYEARQQTKTKKVVQKDNTIRVLSGITVGCLVLLAVVGSRFVLMNSKLFDDNSSINGVNVSGMTSREAEKAVQSMFQRRAETFELNLSYQDQNWSFNKEDFTINSKVHTIIDEAQQRQLANRDYQSQKNKVNQITSQGQELSVAFNYIYTGLDKKIDEIISLINQEPVDSVVSFNPNKKNVFEISKDIDGLKVNKDELFAKINENFMKNNVVNVEIPTVSVKAAVSYEDNVVRTSKVSEYYTNVSDSTGNRKYNVKLALEKINGLTLMPEEVVSFNKLTGPHTLKGGYKTAIIIFQGQFVDGEGGGVCQASTTLYNALLKSDIEIMQVAKHTLPVKYVPLGLDAMVAEGVADLVFKNNKEHPIYIKAYTTSEQAIVEVYGHPLDDGLQIKATSEIVKKLPHGGDIIKQDVAKKHTDKVLFKGEQHRLSSPRSGYETVSYVEYYKNGELVDKKQIRKETYYPQHGIIIEGTEEKPLHFNEIKNDIENVKPETAEENAFMFSMQNYTDLPEIVPTELCP